MSIAVIDPGHGGNTSAGRSTPFGSRFGGGEHEKDVNLALGRRIAAAMPGHVQLTRDHDVNLSLADRVGAARAAQARAFVSVHSGAHGHNEVFVHEHAGADDLALATVLSRELGAPVSRAPFAVLDPRAHAAGCARCLVELDPRLGGDGLADAVARGLSQFLGAAGARYGTPLSNGEFGRVLRDFFFIAPITHDERDLLNDLLRRSSQFMSVVATLDQRVAADDQSLHAQVDRRGIVTQAGPLLGRMLLGMMWNSERNRFEPAFQPEMFAAANMIWVQPQESSNATGRGTFLENVVHETLHALDATQGQPPTTGVLATDLASFIQEEISVRQRTLAIMRQINLHGFHIRVPPMTVREVERDLRSGDDPLTYLESFVIDVMIRDAVAAERLTPSDVSSFRTSARQFPFANTDDGLMAVIRGSVLVMNPAVGLFVPATSTAFSLMVRKRALIQRWRRFQAGSLGTDPEPILQAHAAALFGPVGIAYTP